MDIPIYLFRLWWWIRESLAKNKIAKVHYSEEITLFAFSVLYKACLHGQGQIKEDEQKAKSDKVFRSINCIQYLSYA